MSSLLAVVVHNWFFQAVSMIHSGFAYAKFFLVFYDVTLPGRMYVRTYVLEDVQSVLRQVRFQSCALCALVRSRLLDRGAEL